MLKIVRREWEVETNELVVDLSKLKGFFARADLGGNAVHLVVEDVTEPLREDERKDEVFVFGASLAPRMEQAASQIQTSMDLSGPLLRVAEFFNAFFFETDFFPAIAAVDQSITYF